MWAIAALIFTTAAPVISSEPSCNFTGDLRVNDADAYPGVTLIAPMHRDTAVLVDTSGAVVHRWNFSTTTGKAVLQEDGLLLRLHCRTDFGLSNRSCADSPPVGPHSGGTGGGLERVDWEGRVVWSFATNCTHHDVVPMPNGNVLAVCADWHSEAEVAAAGRVNATALVFASVIEVQPTGPRSGRVVWRWSLFDHVIQDKYPNRRNYGEVRAHPELMDINAVGSVPAQGGDFNHLNAVSYHRELDQVVLSLHHQSEVIMYI